MKLLLDTHALLWWAEGDPRLGRKAVAAITEHGAFVSLASAWELAIKVSLGKLRLARPVHRYFTEQVTQNGFVPLSIDLRHLALVETLPHHHGDPFDRLLVAQALAESLTLVSANKDLSKYKVKRLW